MSFKRAKIVMLATNEKAQAGDLYLFGQPLENELSNVELFISNNVTKQHLYIISDEEIKVNNWVFINILNGKDIIQISKDTLKFAKKYGSKIIATTNNLLTISDKYHICDILPQPSRQFIEKYIEEYNKDNIIVDVLVEYTEIMSEGWIPTYHNPDNINLDIPSEPTGEFELKIDKNNTITIKKIKDSWDKFELKQAKETILFQYAEEHGLLSSKQDILAFNVWINENLFI